LLLPTAICVGQQTHLSTESSRGPLKQFLQKELYDPQFGIDNKTTRFTSAIIQSEGNTKEEIVVYISGPLWCGSGGCTLWILEPDGESFKVIGKMPIVWPPIRVLRTKSHGHYDIGVWVEGGGIQPGYEAYIRFNGKSYPDNPSVPPSHQLTEKVAGKVLITMEDEGELLYK
jgi:hypothetical protein